MIIKMLRIVLPGGTGIGVIEAIHRSPMLLLDQITSLDTAEQIVKIVVQILIGTATAIGVIKQARTLKRERDER